MVSCDTSPDALLATSEFLYIYDCGGEPRKFLDREIDALKNARGTSPIDILFLSHFDRDHICGVPKLIAPGKGLQVDTVVMPFVDDVERTVALARAAALAVGRVIPGFLRDMAIDPVETLRRLGVERVILVMETNGDEDSSGIADPLAPDGGVPIEPRGG